MIRYKQFIIGEFCKYGIVMGIVLLIALAIAVLSLWPLIGMPITLK